MDRTHIFAITDEKVFGIPTIIIKNSILIKLTHHGNETNFSRSLNSCAKTLACGYALLPSSSSMVYVYVDFAHVDGKDDLLLINCIILCVGSCKLARY